jgi:hypothetical protein
MPSITTWTRLEPRARGADLRPSLEGRVYDPAWLLGRQWQIGEFTGEDAGTPAVAQLTIDTAPITAYQAGSGAAMPVGGVPIECLAGPEPAQPRTAAELAQAAAELLVLLRTGGTGGTGGMSSAGQAKVLGSGTVGTGSGPVSAVGAGYLGLVGGRLPDIAALEPMLQSTASSGTAPAALGLSAADAAVLVSSAKAWIAWRDSQQTATGDDADAWQPDRLEHGFRLGVNASASADGAMPSVSEALRAQAWAGDELDWYDVDHEPASTVPQAGGTPSRTVSTVSGPLGPLTYPGMPATRWWQFEDAHVSFAKITADPTDLARMLVVEFACAYSNDWYLRPIELPVGTLSRITNFTVRTTFGDVVQVPPTASPDWCVFRNTSLYRTNEHLAGLLLWPAAVTPVVSEAAEVIQFARDELANLAWALELTVTGEDGMALDRHTHASTSSDGGGVLTPGPRPANPTGTLRYQLASTVPEYWFPMVADADRRFDLRLLQRVDDAGQSHDVSPAGRLLAAATAFSLWQEEVPREGTQVVRERRLVRDLAGRPWSWSARRTSAGRGPASSGLRYDQAVAPDLAAGS